MKINLAVVVVSFIAGLIGGICSNSFKPQQINAKEAKNPAIIKAERIEIITNEKGSEIYLDKYGLTINNKEGYLNVGEERGASGDIVTPSIRINSFVFDNNDVPKTDAFTDIDPFGITTSMDINNNKYRIEVGTLYIKGGIAKYGIRFKNDESVLFDKSVFR